MSSTDISFVLSGGSSNLDPNLSLGGDPSSNPVTTNIINNLFDDLTEDEVTNGAEDYRCFYVFNDGEDPVYNLRMWIYDDFSETCTMELGITSADEVQRLVIAGDVGGGSLTLAYIWNDETLTFTVSYDGDYGAWAQSIQDALRALKNSDEESVLTGVTVSAQAIPDNIIFDITFADYDGKRSHPLIEVVENNLTGAPPTATMSYFLVGGPINTIAPRINLETTPPGGVLFYSPTDLSPLILPVLHSGDGFPIWIKRVTAEGSTVQANDGFTIRLALDTLGPA